MKTNQLVPSSNHIQNAETWIGGPCHHLQKQHIPGYQGHIHGLVADDLILTESQHGKSYAKVTAECLEGRLVQGYDIDKDERYTTNYNNEFGVPNLRKPQLQTAGERILQQAIKQEQIINQQRTQQFEQAPKTLEDIPPIDRMPIVGYQGHRAVYRHPLKKVVPPSEPEKYIHPLNTLRPDDAKTMLDTNKDFRVNFEPKEAPVVGYTGFMKGIRAENMYGQTFKDISSQVIQNK